MTSIDIKLIKPGAEIGTVTKTSPGGLRENIFTLREGIVPPNQVGAAAITAFVAREVTLGYAAEVLIEDGEEVDVAVFAEAPLIEDRGALVGLVGIALAESGHPELSSHCGDHLIVNELNQATVEPAVALAA